MGIFDKFGSDAAGFFNELKIGKKIGDFFILIFTSIGTIFKPIFAKIILILFKIIFIIIKEIYYILEEIFPYFNYIKYLFLFFILSPFFSIFALFKQFLSIFFGNLISILIIFSIVGYLYFYITFNYEKIFNYIYNIITDIDFIKIIEKAIISLSKETEIIYNNLKTKIEKFIKKIF